MNLTRLFDMQETLDRKIEEQHHLGNEELIEKKTLALLVELGELANETRCFKFWSLKPASDPSVILEEYVDGIHFILSLGIELKLQNHVKVERLIIDTALTEQFLAVYTAIDQFKQDYSKLRYLILFNEYINLGEQLGFTTEQIEEAYMKKNQVNHERQEQGY
ncbi:dUTP diphosphatase [Metabacillus arenae]|uniref:dUTP diphosphatase n=1 Tax=Metabacillus arenae TaxID=2771434 RepID=A0A926NGG6_9BACI|nr:dUTP diphosphatase [Metabacillus arenae]MBD1380068.1 dUTP diphosphatase [Metabacillus arenae]